jgi:hypothetical protein
LGTLFGIDGELLERQYRNHLSGYLKWDQLPHAEEWILFEKNIGAYVGIDEVGGHGGMDFIMDSRLVYCLQNGLPLDMDVYDLAEWCCLAELGALSMDNNCAAVQFPDFTRGHWNDVKGFTAKLKEQGAKEWAAEK